LALEEGLEEIVASVKELFTMKQIILYGSKARNDDTVDSDIDI
jgi:predicted nucleotidyltransferase